MVMVTRVTICMCWRLFLWTYAPLLCFHYVKEYYSEKCIENIWIVVTRLLPSILLDWMG